MAKPKLLGSKYLFRGYFDVKQDLLEKENGDQLPYTHFSLSADAVVILAQLPDKRFLVTREYRHPTGGFLMGCPGGKLEPGENPIEGGRRELLEETGYSSPKLSLLGASYPMPAMCNQRVFFLFAEEAVPTASPSLDPFEFITPELISLQEIGRAVQSGVVLDGHLLTALSMYQLRHPIA